MDHSLLMDHSLFFRNQVDLVQVEQHSGMFSGNFAVVGFDGLRQMVYLALWRSSWKHPSQFHLSR